MKAVLASIGAILVLAPGIFAQAPYGIDRRELNEPFLNRRLPTTAAGPFPLKLSETGAFENTATLTPMRTLIPYMVNTALWSDATDKTRWLFVPKDAKIGFTTTNWSFPVGTVFVKHFDLVTNEVSGAKRRLETRFLVVDSGNDVYGVTYKWRSDNSDADLLSSAGMNETIAITTATGTRTQTWGYPSRAGCLECHTKDNGGAGNKGVLGVKTAQQNGNYTYPSGVTDNQLRTLNHIGIFQPALVEANIPALPKMAAITDTTFNMETRVRSYLDANCAHCHNPNGTANGMGALFDANFHMLFSQQGIVNTANHYISFTNVAKSDILTRDAIRGDRQMPPLGTTLVDSTWTNLLIAWINTSFNPVKAATTPLRDKVIVTFNGLPEATSALNIANYTLTSAGAVPTLQTPALDPNEKTVTFDLSAALDAGELYTLVVNNVRDRNTPVNTNWPNHTLKFVAGNALVQANDNWNNAALLVGANAVAQAMSCGATKELGEPDHAGRPGGASLWWQWTAPVTETVTIETFGSQADTLLAVYTGGSVSNLSLVAANDNFLSLYASRVTFPAIAGVTYYIAVDGDGGDCGSISLNLYQSPLAQPPANDQFANTIALSGTSGSVSATNHHATKESDEPNHGNNSGGASVWWSWTAPADGVVTIDTHGSTFDTTLGVYFGGNVAELTSVAQDDDADQFVTSSVQFTAAVGVTYHIAVDGYYGAAGNITLNYSHTPLLLALAANFEAVPYDGRLLLQVSGPVGARVEIQASDDLVYWKTITTTVLTSETLLVPEAISSSTTQRFYRTVRRVDPTPTP